MRLLYHCKTLGVNFDDEYIDSVALWTFAVNATYQSVERNVKATSLQRVIAATDW